VRWGNLPPLKLFRSQPAERKRYPLAFVAGVILACAFPKIGVAGLGWLAPMLILASAMGHRGLPAFRVGWVAGLGFHLASLYWLLLIPVKFLPILGWLAVSIYLAVYQGLWVWLCWEWFPKKLSSPLPGWLPILEQFMSSRWLERVRWGLLCAALWIATEMTQARVFGGFPWNLLGASQYRMLPVIQIASFASVYGISFLMVWFSVALLAVTASLVRHPVSRRLWLGEILLPMGFVAAIIAFGFQQVRQYQEPTRKVKIALIQPSIPQVMIWDRNKADARFAELIQLSEKALLEKPDLLVWPEAAVPNVFRYETNTYHAVTNLVQQHRVWLIMGADDIVAPPDAKSEADLEWFNSSFLISPDGAIRGIYQKQQLVMFGEYVPFTKWLPFIAGLVQSEGNFTRGKGPVTFDLPSLGLKTSVLICFEDVFPHLARKYVNTDLDFLLNLTNNGWFGESAAQWQHAASAIFRAIENGLPLVRAANNGLSCWVDSIGRLHNVYFEGTKDIYGVGYKIVNVPVLSGARRSPAFYTVYGDWFGWTCVGISVFGLARTIMVLRGRKKETHD
jgi:apolipoprotein N-acyltransferase